MAYHIYAWSDIPGDWRASSRRDARGGADDDTGNAVSVVQLSNNAAFEALLQGMIATGQKADLMEFHTHGSGGAVWLGPDALTAVQLKDFEPKGYDRAFNAGATINLTGCNCAETAFGELLLVQFARSLLRTGGGKVTGSTGAGIAIGGLLNLIGIDSGAVWHPFGKWVTAEATPGGAVTLFNNFHLDLDHINTRIQHVERSWSWLDEGEQKTVKAELETAKTFLPPLAAWDYWNFFGACQHVEKAEKILQDAIEASPVVRASGGGGF
jgi:hypothetical protein